MKVKRHVDFKAFCATIEEAAFIHDAQRELEEGYRQCVARVFDEFYGDATWPYGQSRDVRIENWFELQREHFGARWVSLPVSTFGQAIRNLRQNNGSIDHAAAIHFRFHADASLRRYADEIDGVLFRPTEGLRFKTPVFEFLPEDDRTRDDGSNPKYQKPPGFSYPRVVDLKESYQAHRPEFEAAKALLLEGGGQSVSLSAAVYGAGGYGKSSLAQEICSDKDIRKAFPGGVYWLQFGMEVSDRDDVKVRYRSLSEAIEWMLLEQFSQGDRPKVAMEGTDRDIASLIDNLPSAPILLVADDVWTANQCSWFTRESPFTDVSERISLLVTTRIESVAKQVSTEVKIERMSPEASFKLLTHGMRTMTPSHKARLRQIAEKFKGWPLLLSLANGVFKDCVGRSSEAIDEAITLYEEFLDSDDIAGWDLPDLGSDHAERRQKFVGYCIDASLTVLEADHRPDLLLDLAVFPDDTDIPISVIIDYWCHDAEPDLTPVRAGTLLRKYRDFSFFSSSEQNPKSVRIHDEILDYFRGVRKEELPQLHQRLACSFQQHCKGPDWDTLGHHHRYGWLNLLRHLEGANLIETANALRSNFNWIKQKLNVTSVVDLQREYSGVHLESETKAVGRAISVASPVLSMRRSALPHQLYGRIGHDPRERLQQLVVDAQLDEDFYPRIRWPHLNRLGNEILAFQVNDCVSSAVFSANRKRVLTAAADGTVQLWDSETGQPLGESMRHSRRRTTAAFCPNDQQILTATNLAEARLWNAHTGRPLQELVGHNGGITSATFNYDGQRVLTSSTDGVARLWDSSNGQRLGRSMLHNDRIHSAVFSSDGQLILTGSRDGNAQLWDGETGDSIGEPIAVGGDVTSTFFCGRRSILTVGSDVRLWDCETGQSIGDVMRHGGKVLSAVCSSDGRRIITVNKLNSVYIWNGETGRAIGKLLSQKHNIVRALFSPDERSILTISVGGIVELWDSETGHRFGKPMLHNEELNGALFSRDGRRIITASKKGKVRIWDTENKQTVGNVTTNFARLNSITFSEDCRRILTASRDGCVRLWDGDTGCPINDVMQHEFSAKVAVFGLGEQYILSASADETARLWDGESGRPIGQVMQHSGEVRYAAFSPDWNRVLTLSDDYEDRTKSTVQVWCVRTRQSIASTVPDKGRVDSIQFSPDGKRILTTSIEGGLQFWDQRTLDPLSIAIKPEEFAPNASFGLGGRRILTWSEYDVTARLWDSETGQQICDGLFHPDSIRSAFFCPSGQRALTLSDDSIVRLWSAATGEPVGQPLPHQDFVNRVLFSDDGDRVLTLSNDGAARIWDSETGLAVGTVLSHDRAVKDGVFCSNGLKVAILSDDYSIHIWDLTTFRWCTAVDFDESVEFIVNSPFRDRVIAVFNSGRFVALDY